jgi:predicted SnoaL-like aldol condensation-catalyzing enzyme
MSIEANKALVRRWQYDVLNAHSFDLFDDVLHPNFVLHDANVHGREAARALFKEWMSNPSGRFESLDMFGEGDKVVSRWVLQDGDKRWKGISIFRIAEGKIIEDWFCSEEIKPD